MNLKAILNKNKRVKSCLHRVKESIFEVATVISPELNTKMRYKLYFGKNLDLKNPVTLNEKILWLKLNKYMRDPLVIKCADKYAVREYVKQCGCGDILNSLLGVYDNADEIPWESLPNQFALKWNFGATYNVICTDKSKMNKDEVLRQLKVWGKTKYWLSNSEMQYKYIPRKIICESLLNDTVSGVWTAPKDYKVYCFNGEPKYVMVCVGREKGTVPKFLYYDSKWNLMPYSQDALDNPDLKVEKPACLEKLFECAAKLSKPFPFVRADFYCCQDKVYFGELTFTPSGGLDSARLKDVDRLFGEMVKLYN